MQIALVSDDALANEAAFFILIPLGVFLHEAGHTLATWQVGGEVADFQWRVFWGYIVPVGNFTPLQSWWIALSGNLVSILLGLLPIPLLPRSGKTIWGEVLYAYVRHELFYALVWYPAISVVGFGGDWTMIYDFSVTPYAPVTLTLHILLLYGLWRLDKSTWAAHWRIRRDPEAQAALQKLEAEAEMRRGTVKPLLNLAHFYHQQGEAHLSRHYTALASRLAPTDPAVAVNQALMAYNRQDYRTAQSAARRALSTALTPDEQSQMHQVLAFVCMRNGHRAEALAHFDAALGLTPDRSTAYYWRGILKRSLGRLAEARADFDSAARLATDEESRAQARQELESA